MQKQGRRKAIEKEKGKYFFFFFYLKDVREFGEGERVEDAGDV